MILLLWVALLLLTACGGNQETVAPTPTRVRPTATPAPTPLPPLPTSPPLGSEENPLVMIFVAAEPDNLADAAADLADEYSTSDMVVDVRIIASYAEAYRALCDGSAHVVSLNAFTTLAAEEAGCGDKLYVSEFEGETGVQGQMLSAVGRNIFTVIGFRGQEFCRTSADSVITWIIPSLSMRANGVNPFTDIPQVIDKETDEGVVNGIFTRECDVGATTIGAHEGIANPNPTLSGRILVIEELPPVPYDAILLSLRASDETRAILLDIIGGSEEDLAALIGVDTLLDADDADQDIFGGLEDLFETAGVDPAALAQ